MSNFDLDAYFASKITADSVNSKMGALEKASQEKAASLEVYRKQAEEQQARRAAEEQARSESWAGQLGLDTDGFLGARVNDVASVVTGVGRLAGNVASLPASLSSMAATSAATPEEVEAFNRSKTGNVQPGDADILARRVSPNGYTMAERLALAEQRRKDARAITGALDFSKSIDPTNRNALVEDIGRDFEQSWGQVTGAVDKAREGNVLGAAGDAAGGIAKLLYQAGSAVLSNPAGVREFVLENAPQLLVGAAGKAGGAALAASNIGYAADVYQQGIENYAKANGGQLPSNEERQRMAIQAASLALAEQASDMVGLGLGKLGAKAATDALGDGAVASFKNVMKAAAGGAASEAPTEGYQTYMEGEITGQPASAKEVFTGAVIGGASGGVLTGSMRAAAEAMKAAPEKVVESEGDKALKARRAELLALANETGDVSGLVEPGSPHYSPESAIAALQGFALRAASTDEDRAAAIQKAGEVVEGMQARRAELEAGLQKNTPAGIERTLKAAQAELEQAQQQNDAPEIERLSQLVPMLQEELAAVKAPESAKDYETAAESFRRDLAKLDDELGAARVALSTFNEEVQPRDLDPEVEAQSLDAADPVGSQAKVDRIINLSMATPERLTVETASALASNAVLSEAQRTYFRTFTEARIAENSVKSLGKVSTEIFSGGKDFKGLAAYRSDVAAAIGANQQAAATREIDQLEKFAQDHKAKAAAVVRAYRMFQQDGKERMVVSDGQRGWSIQPGHMPKKQRDATGTVNVDAKTVKLAKALPKESTAINAALDEVRAAYALKYPTPSSSTTQSKNDGTQAPEAQQGPAQGPQVAAAGEAAARAGAAAPATAAVAQPDLGRTLEAAGLNTASESTEVASGNSVNTEQNAAVEEQKTTQSTATAQREEDAKPTAAEQPQSSDSAASPEVEPTEGVDEGTDVVPVLDSPEVAVEAGTLSAVTTKSPEGTEPRLRNLIADYFTQTASREGDSTPRPLVKVANFLSMGMAAVAEYLPKGMLEGKGADDRRNAIAVFKKAATHWNALFPATIRRGTEGFWREDMLQYLIQEDDGTLDLPENVKTAMSYAAFSWIAENAAGSKFNTDAEINAILGRDEDHEVSREEKKALGLVGVRQNVVVNALGQRAIQALGLTPITNAPRDVGPRLESALGARIVQMLIDEEVMVRTTISGEKMAALTGKESTKKDVSFFFLKLARDEAGKLSSDAQAIADAVRGTRNVVDKLFKVEPGLKEPSLEPIPFEQKTTKNTRQEVPKKLAKIIAAKNAEANYVRQDMWQLITLVGKDVALAMAGVRDPDAFTHKANIDSINAKNDGLEREYDRFMAFVGSMDDLEAPMYFEHSVWKQQRVGIATNAVNPQTSKLHRFMLYRKQWETTVDPTDAAQMDNFRLRVLEGLGVKTDKQANEASLRDYAKTVGQPEIQAAVDVIVKALNGEGISDAEQLVLRDGVKAGGTNFHSLDALMALAHEKMAGGKPFTVQMMGEIDGVTNGPMLSHLLLGAANTVSDLFGLLNRGGFFKKGDPEQNYNRWRGLPGNQDLYEVTGKRMLENVRALIAGAKNSDVIAQSLAAIYTFTGNLEGDDKNSAKARRTIVKKPLTALVFGSSTGSAVDGMADVFIDSIYEGIEDAARKGGSGEAQLKAINTLLAAAKFKPLKVRSIEQLLTYEFTDAERGAIKRAFKNSLGKAVETTMESEFAVFMGRRNALNEAAQLAFELYNAIYTAQRDIYIGELMVKGEMPVNSKGEALHDLTPTQERELRNRLALLAPVSHTLMSKDSKQLRAGLYSSKSGRTLSQRPAYKNEVKLGKGTMEVNSYEQIEENPGVGMVVMLIHSTDSAISHMAAALAEVLNIHDAHGSGLGTFEQTARNLNRATFEAMLRYSPANELADMLGRTVTGLTTVLSNEGVKPEVKANLLAAVKKIAEKREMDASALVANTLQGARSAAFQADDMKFQALAEMQAVDQYALEGGQYVVTEEDRAKAVAGRAGLSGQITAQEAQALARLDEVLGIGKLPTEQEQAATAVFGPIGEPRIASQPDLVAFFRANPVATASQVLNLLKAPSRLSGANVAILKLVERTLAKADPDLKIRFVTPDTDPSTLLAPPKEAARGWYVATEGGKTEIYVLSPDFANSGLSSETLLHELVHAAIARTIHKPSEDAKALIAELEVLRKKAAAYAEANGLGFGQALVDLQEFVAWGMTNAEFQKKVLREIRMPSKTTGNRLVSGMQKFVQTLARLLTTKKSDPVIETGLGVLINNVSGLFAEAAEQQGGADVALNLSQATVAAIDRYTTQEIFQALGNGQVSYPFQQHLSGLLEGIVQSLHGPFGAIADAMRKTEAGNPMAVWLKAVQTGKAPFASQIVASNLTGSAQEDFVAQQVEATVLAALDGSETTSSSIYRELAKLYAEAKARITPADVGGQDAYDALFKMTSGQGGKSDYLARFAALGLANEKINGLLKFDTKSAPSGWLQGKTVADKLMHLFDKVLSLFNAKLAKVYAGQRADEKLESLIGQLVDMEARKRHALALRATMGPTVVENLEARFKTAAEAVRNKVADVAANPVIRNNANAFVRGAGTASRLIARQQVDQFMDQLRKLRDSQFKERDGFGAAILTELMGPKELYQALLRGTKHLENLRKKTITQHAKLALSTFKDGASFTKDQSASVTRVFLRTGLHHLTDEFSLAELEQLVGDPVAIDRAITDLESRLDPQFRARWIEQVNALGFYKAQGKVRTPVLMLNAHLISRLAGTPGAAKVGKAQAAAAEPTLAALASLYALKYTDKSAQKAAKDIFRTENARTDGNGVQFVMSLAREMEAEALDKLFGGNPALMIHGYTPEILNPHTAIQVANEADGQDLLDQGYVRGAEVVNDGVDRNAEDKHIYVQKDGGLAPWLSGVFSISAMKAKGTTQHNGYMNVNNLDGLMNAALQADITNEKFKQIGRVGNPKRDLSNDHRNHLAPVFNDSGAIVNWRYMMAEQTKDTVLERDNRFDQVIGALAGSIFDKSTAGEQNAKVVKALREQYEAEYPTNPDAYVLVGSKSSDKGLKEVWDMLPDPTQREIRKVWGKDGMWVRKDSVDILFGYRKYSLAEMFDKEPDARKGLTKFVAGAIEGLLSDYARWKGMSSDDAERFARRAKVYVTRGERIWQEIVKETKDIIVVKTGVVLVGNIWSNFSLLAAKGVSFKDMLHHHQVALQAAMAHTRDSERLASLETLVRTGMDSSQATADEIVKLKDAIARNPVKALIDEGLMPSIGEDVAAEDDPFSYKSEFVRKTEAIANATNPLVRTVAKNVYMARDTWMYRSLHRTTQLSDFVARYTLYQHLTSRAQDPLSHADAVQEASEAFVNYDIPMHRGLQYTDDMGITPFTKYFLRIQRVLAKTARDNPARVLAMVALNNLIDLGPIVLDSSFVAHFGNNPINAGAFKYPTVLDDLATVSGAMALVK